MQVGAAGWFHTRRRRRINLSPASAGVLFLCPAAAPKASGGPDRSQGRPRLYVEVTGCALSTDSSVGYLARKLSLRQPRT